jgi:hypothetical protein
MISKLEVTIFDLKFKYIIFTPVPPNAVNLLKTMAKELQLTDAIIERKIYIIRGKKVMLDRDLAEIYGVETKRLKDQVKRNISRFPNHFMFELTIEESNSLRSQNATLKRGAHAKYTASAFT